MADPGPSLRAETEPAGAEVAAAGRPLRADAARNREKVLRAARNAFAESGYGVPLDEIAVRAGVGPGTVYRHFPTKEAGQATRMSRLNRPRAPQPYQRRAWASRRSWSVRRLRPA